MVKCHYGSVLFRTPGGNLTAVSDDVEVQLERIGDQLRIARVKAYLTQSDVGQRAGVSRQLVSRIEQGINGEIRAYVAVAAALNHRFIVEEQEAVGDVGIAALDLRSETIPLPGIAALDFRSETIPLDFTSETVPTDQTGPKASSGGRKPKKSGTTKAKRR